MPVGLKGRPAETGMAAAAVRVRPHGTVRPAVLATMTIDEVRALALTLPRSHEALVRDRVKFRVGRIVYLAFSRDETIMGFAFPKDERPALVETDRRFLLPKPSDLRYNWVCVHLEMLCAAEMEELVTDAWRMVVPKRIAAAHLGS